MNWYAIKQINQTNFVFVTNSYYLIVHIFHIDKLKIFLNHIPIKVMPWQNVKD